MAEAFAPAKINLTLHVTGQRADGYHLLDSLVVFVDIGDRITARTAPRLSLTVDGPQAAGVPADDRNLVWRAARLLDPDRGAALTLTKNLPPASGIGGGSSDAAAALRALSRLWDLPLPDMSALLALGADLPVCMTPAPQRLRGTGEVLTPVAGVPPLDILLVNPGVSVATPSVFRALARRAAPPMPDDLPDWSGPEDFCRWLARQRNDLQVPALSLVPEIGTVLSALSDTGPLFAGMSGSGATCFALFGPGTGRAAAAHARITGTRPTWWAAHGTLL